MTYPQCGRWKRQLVGEHGSRMELAGCRASSAGRCRRIHRPQLGENVISRVLDRCSQLLGPTRVTLFDGSRRRRRRVKRHRVEGSFWRLAVVFVVEVCGGRSETCSTRVHRSERLTTGFHVRPDGRLSWVGVAMLMEREAPNQNRDREAQGQEELRSLHLGGDSAPERGSISRCSIAVG